MPVLTIERVEDAVPLARALVKGGVRTLEVTLRTPVAVEAAKAIIAEVPDAIVGIGTILNADDLARAEALGAKFGISPGATPELLKAAAGSSLPFAPGIATASELMAALAHGFDLVKFFPAEQSGGIKALRALAGPFPQAHFCPTGGIGEANAPTWLAEPNVVAVGGSWLCPPAEIRSGNWAGITAICERQHEIAESRPPIGYNARQARFRETSHDRQHRRMGAYAVRKVRRRDRRKPRHQGRQRSAGRCRHRGSRRRRDRARPFQRRLLAAGFHRLAGAAGRSESALQAGDPRRERLRHGIGRRASGHPRHRMQGNAKIVLVVGVEQMTRTPSAEIGKNLLKASYLPEDGDVVGGFAGVFGKIAQGYFQKYGDQSDALAMIAAKNHKNGVANPYAQMRKDFGFEFCRSESEKNPYVAGPLKRTDCSLVSDGAAALVLMDAESAKGMSKAINFRASRARAGFPADVASATSCSSRAARWPGSARWRRPA